MEPEGSNNAKSRSKTLNARSPRSRANEKNLRSAWSAEEQAIAIYSIEHWIVGKTCWTPNRKKSLQSFRKILQEEKSHQNAIRNFVSSSPMDNLFSVLNRFAGYSLGTLLTVIPSRLSWKIHAIAELQAETIYRDALSKVSSDTIREKLTQAADQEREHADHFENLLKACRSK